MFLYECLQISRCPGSNSSYRPYDSWIFARCGCVRMLEKNSQLVSLKLLTEISLEVENDLVGWGNTQYNISILLIYNLQSHTNYSTTRCAIKSVKRTKVR